MDVELLTLPGCPHAAHAQTTARQALDHLGLAHTPVRVTVITTPEQAHARSFPGSPTFLIDGTDPFPTASASTGLSCRLYPTPDGPRGAPTVPALATAIAGTR